MTRFMSVPRALVLVVAVTMSMLTWAPPAHADDPIPTILDMSVLGSDLEEATEVTLSASLHSAVRPINGTVTFSDEEGNVLAEVPVSNYSNGSAHANHVIPKPTEPTTYFAEYHSTDGHAVASDSFLYRPRFLKTVTVTAEPTLLRLGTGLLPQFTLTLAATATLEDGTGVPGIHVDFYAVCDPGPRNCFPSIPLCSADTDVHGFASCNGAGTFGALLSILSGVVKMSAYQTPGGPEKYHIASPSRIPPLIG